MISIENRLKLSEKHKDYDQTINKLQRQYTRAPHWNLQRQITELKKEKLKLKTILERNPVLQE